MPLTRTTVTAASRVMLPAYVITFAWIGGAWVFTDEGYLINSPALDYANNLLPLPAWGGLLLGVAALILGAMLSRHRLLCRVALWIAFVVMCVFVVVFAAASIGGLASPSAAAWPFLFAAACFASDRSLLNGEVS